MNQFNKYLPYSYNYSRSNPPPPPAQPPPKPPNPKKKKNPHKKFDFIAIKKNTCNSLNDVEYFLNNFSNFIKYIKIYYLFK